MENSLDYYVNTVYNNLVTDGIYDITSKQISNIAIKMLHYNISPDNYMKVLEYAAMIRATIITYITQVIYPYNPSWNYFATNDYAIRRVLTTMGLLDSEIKPIMLSYLEQAVSQIESEIKIDKIYSLKK